MQRERAIALVFFMRRARISCYYALPVPPARRRHDAKMPGNPGSSPMTDTVSPPARRLAVLRALWPYLRPYRLQLLQALALLCLASATLLLVPLAFRDLIDSGFGQGAATRERKQHLQVGSRQLVLRACNG